MASYPADLKYTKDHEWARVTGNRAIVGITDFAKDQLGDVVYLELPEVGATLRKGEPFGVVESTKAVSELFAPCTGKVLRVNAELVKAPEGINEDAYGKGWLIEVEMSSAADAAELLDAKAYEQVVASS